MTTTRQWRWAICPRLNWYEQNIRTVGRGAGSVTLGIEPVHIHKQARRWASHFSVQEIHTVAFDTEKYTKSPFLKGDDLEEGERSVVTIKSAEEVDFPSGDRVPVLEFLELDQKLTLNKTRVKKLVELLGEDTDEWKGRKISLYRIDVQYNGKTMPGVAVAAAPKGKQGPMQPEVSFEKKKAGVDDYPFN